jgi:cellulose synthase/poly-beta-1,6-N-acetylglucosamine synthase-like glycosyltransferase
MGQLILITYLLACFILMVFGLNCHVMIYLFRRHLSQRRLEDRRVIEAFHAHGSPRDLPFVTSQIPLYNELNVAERIIDAVACFDYPSDKHEIQILDDSTDDTQHVVSRKVKALRKKGLMIEHIIRRERTGFKAGALRHGLEKARGELTAIFDADFVPQRDFLLKTVPFFVMDRNLGLVQTRWGHLAADSNLIVILQSIGINGHFMIEQSARNWNGLLMNFNGTAGVLRKSAILDVGNWQEDTLTEDMDLSYRIQLGGWGCRYLIDVVTPAEIPEDINAFKSQQFRWAKGSIQTAMKLLPRLWASPHNVFCKLQATLHLTHYLVHPLMAYLAVAGPFLLIFTGMRFSMFPFLLITAMLVVSFPGPSRLYWTAERYASERWWARCLLLPLLICFGCGLAINNTRGVVEALFRKKSPFIRTPKRGSLTKKRYRALVDGSFALEILVSLWCFSGLLFFDAASTYLLRPFLFLYALGFLYVGVLSFLHMRR